MLSFEDERYWTQAEPKSGEILRVRSLKSLKLTHSPPCIPCAINFFLVNASKKHILLNRNLFSQRQCQSFRGYFTDMLWLRYSVSRWLSAWLDTNRVKGGNIFFFPIGLTWIIQCWINLWLQLLKDRQLNQIDSQDWRWNLDVKLSVGGPERGQQRKVISRDAAVSMRSSVKSSSVLLSQQGLMSVRWGDCVTDGETVYCADSCQHIATVNCQVSLWSLWCTAWTNMTKFETKYQPNPPLSTWGYHSTKAGKRGCQILVASPGCMNQSEREEK